MLPVKWRRYNMVNGKKNLTITKLQSIYVNRNSIKD